MSAFFRSVAVIGFASVLSGQGAPEPSGGQQPVLAPGTAFILGRVVEAGSTTGVSNAIVTLTGAALGAPTAKFANGTPGGPRRAFVDAQGQFLFRDLPAGVYSLSATAAGFVDGAYGRTQPVRRPLDPVRSLEIIQTDTRVTATIPMWKIGGISGRVTDEAGEPMVGAPITLLARVSGTSGTRVVANVTTDDRGVYHADVPPGDYLVCLIAATTTVPASAVEGFLQAQREGGATMQAYMAQVTAGGALLPRGVGTRVGNVMVSQFGMRNAWVVPPFAIRDGRLSFYPTTFHPASVTGPSASIVTVASGEEKPGIDVQLRPAPARRVSGRVVGPNGPVANIAVRLIAPDSTVMGSQTMTNDSAQALADGNAEFTLLGVAPGSYTVRVIREPSDTEPVLWAADQLTVGADTDVTDLQIRLQTGATIGGRVVVEGPGPPPAPAALRAITVRPLAVPGSVASFVVASPAWVVRPDENSRFRTRQVVPGPYLMPVDNVPSGWTLKSVTAGGQDAVDRPFNVPMSGRDDLVVTITQRISTLAGVVRDATGQPAPSATVAVFPVDTSLWPPPGIVGSRRIQTAAPSRDGAYTLRSLPAGEYFVVASDGAADFSDARARTASISGASRVTIIEGDRTTQDLRVVIKR